jgi:hypothetical protein
MKNASVYFQEQTNRGTEFPHTFYTTPSISDHLKICTFRRPVCYAGSEHIAVGGTTTFWKE